MPKLNISTTEWKKKFFGSTAPKPTRIYTGTNMVGIAQIPKSNAVPVFSSQEAKDTVKVK
jgi:hypothetical protein